jgi:hypothetical protein
MHDALAMRFVQRVGDFHAELQHLLERQRPFLQTRRECFAFQVLHDEVLGPILRAHIMQRTNVGMIQRGDRTGFAFETLPRFGRIGQMLRQYLNRHGAVEPRIPRAINLSHPARAQRRTNLVRS